MTSANKMKSFVKSLNDKYAYLLWYLLSFVAFITKISDRRHNNFKIFYNSFGHLADNLPLYIHYPGQYNDLYLYGPLFALLVAPIYYVCQINEVLGMFLWIGFLSWSLLVAINKMDIKWSWKLFIILFSANELVTSLMMQQFNVFICAVIILTFAYMEKGKYILPAFLISLGLLTKIYGIVALAFFPFCKNKLKFSLSFAIWCTFLFVLTAVFVGWDYMIGQYSLWIETLSHKGNLNLMALMQNISALGMIRKISGNTYYSDLYVLIPAVVVFMLPFLRFDKYGNTQFRMLVLSSVLLFVVLFSTGSESSSYIICFPAIALWYLNSGRSIFDKIVVAGCFILSSLSPTDIFPKYLRDSYVIPYALKALFPTIVWLRIQTKLIFGKFAV